MDNTFYNIYKIDEHFVNENFDLDIQCQKLYVLVCMFLITTFDLHAELTSFLYLSYFV